MNPKVSVIVPVYNVEKYLSRCVESIRRQTLSDIEIILVDDESPDNCPAMCDEYALQDPRVRVVHKKNGGLGMACNSGLDIAIGEYVAFCDSDDWVEPDMYAHMYTEAVKRPADMVFCGIRQIDQHGRIVPMAQTPTLKIYETRTEIEGVALDMIASRPNCKSERLLPMSAKIVLYKRKLIVDNGLHFESERRFITEDLFFNLDCLMCARSVVELPATYYNYFINTSSLSRVVRTDRFEKIKIVYKELLKRYEFSSAEFQLRCMRMFIGYARVALCQIGSAGIPFVEKYKHIHAICCDSVWTEIHNKYPLNCMPRFHGFFQWLVCHRFCLPIILAAKIRR